MTDAILTLAQLVLGLLVKYWPPLGRIANAAIPFLNTTLALLVKVLVPQPAHADVVGAILPPALGFLGPILQAGWSAVRAGLIYEFFGRHPLDALGWQKVVAPASPVK